MIPAVPRSLRRVLVTALALAATLAAGCRRPLESDTAAATEETKTEAKAEVVPTPEPTPIPPGQHSLTVSPPVSTADLDRLLGLGFTPEEVLAEVERRGVLRRPDAGERAHILTLPHGEHFVDAMESSRNLLSSDALDLYSHRLAGRSDQEQWKANHLAAANNDAYEAQRRYQASALREQQYREYQRRYSDLASRLTTLKQRRAEMQRRGEMTISITMEIDRLEREAAALVEPF